MAATRIWAPLLLDILINFKLQFYCTIYLDEDFNSLKSILRGNSSVLATSLEFLSQVVSVTQQGLAAMAEFDGLSRNGLSMVMYCLQRRITPCHR